MSNKKKRGSALLLATILLFVVLSMVITLTYVTVMEQKMSSKTKSSVGSFFAAESGVEWVLNKLALSSGTIASNFTLGSDGSIECPFAGTLCKVYLLGADGRVITPFTPGYASLTITDVKAVRSVGTQGNETQRAIEAAAAAGGGWVDEGSVVHLVDDEDYVGIGTNNPLSKLHIQRFGEALRLEHADNQYSDIVWYNGSHRDWVIRGNAAGFNEGALEIWAPDGGRAVKIIGDLSVSGVKNFDIKDPRYGDENRRLIHSSLEGPEVGVYYRGEGELSNGEAIVELPAYFEALTLKEGRTVQLTARGNEPYFLSAGEIRDGKFRVVGTKPDGKFYWEVKAIRGDVPVLEVEKNINSAQH